MAGVLEEACDAVRALCERGVSACFLKLPPCELTCSPRGLGILTSTDGRGTSQFRQAETLKGGRGEGRDATVREKGRRPGREEQLNSKSRESRSSDVIVSTSI